MSRKITTPEFRVSFPNVFQAKALGEGKPKYSITMMFPKSNPLTDLRAIMAEAAMELWPDKDKRPKGLISPIKDGDTDVMQDGTLRKDKYPEVAGHWIVMASSLQRVGVVDENIQPIIKESDFYSGCYAIATITAFAYAPSKARPLSKTGVSFGLQNVKKTRDGEPFSGRASAQDDFGAPTGAPKGSGDGDMFG